MYSLRLLGGLTITARDGLLDAAATQRRRLMLLAMLAVAHRKGVPRARVAALLWPDASEERARHALEQLVYGVRRTLGRDVVVADAGMLRLDHARVASDVVAFREALEAGDDLRAVAAWGGRFLDGALLSGTDEFERWAAIEDARLRREYHDALERLAVAAARAGDSADVVRWRRQRLADDPCDTAATCALMRALAAAGDVAAARHQAALHAAVMRSELDAEPDTSVLALTEELARHEPVQQEHVPVTATPNVPRPVPAAPRQPAAVAGTAPRVPRWRTAVGISAAAAAAIVLAASYGPPVRAWNEPSGANASPVAMAVLPLRDLTRNGTGNSFSDGVTEELIHELSQVRTLRIVARTSAFRFRERVDDVRRIGRQLNAAVVLEGSIRRLDGRVQITVQLVDVATGFTRWSERFERPMAELLPLQREIAGAVASRMTRENGNSRRIAVVAPDDYQQYLRARFALREGTPEAVARGTAALDTLTRHAPSYARGWAWLAAAHNQQAEQHTGTPQQAVLLASAERAARRSIALDPELAEAHEVLGRLLVNRWVWEEAEQSFARATALNPSGASAHASYGVLLALQGRFDEAVASMERAQHLDPLSEAVHAKAGYVLVLSRRYADAERLLRTVVRADTAQSGPRFLLATALLHAGRHEEAERELRSVMRLAAPPSGALPLLGYTQAMRGDLPRAAALTRGVERGLRDGSVSPYFSVAYFAAVGDTTRALGMLADLGSRRESCLRDVAVDPAMDLLHRSPRFQVLVRQLGLQGSGLH